ncbi:MAG: hypothetical protein WDN06_17795 [Asticcacaulis sp.]
MSQDFVVQTGDPGNVDGGKTELPNLKPEFTFRLTTTIPHKVYARPPGISEGFIGALPYNSVSEEAKPKRDDGRSRRRVRRYRRHGRRHGKRRWCHQDEGG